MNNKTDEPPPVVSHRLNALSITDFVDQTMERLPETLVLNMADQQQRNHLRAWMTSAFTKFLQAVVWDMQKGADRGIEQIATLIRDPSYYQTTQRRRQLARERRVRQQAESEAISAKYRKEAEDEALAMQRLIESGRVSLLNTRLNVGNLPEGEKGPRGA